MGKFKFSSLLSRSSSSVADNEKKAQNRKSFAGFSSKPIKEVDASSLDVKPTKTNRC